MSLLPSLLLLALLALQLNRSSCEERRTDVMRAVLSGPAEPGFWPSRGRRSEGSGEEQPPPFWAHRGRELPCSLFAEQEYAPRRGDQDMWPARGRKRSQDN